MNQVWVVVSTRPSGTSVTVFAFSAKQSAIDYACNMDADGWTSSINLELVLSSLPVNAKY